jgi:hypothetical protein
MKPSSSLGELRSKLESDRVVNFRASNTGQRFWDSFTLDRKIIDNGDGGLVTAVFTLKKSLNKGLVDVAKKILDRLVFHHRPFFSYGALKDTYTLRVLIKNGFDILCSPQGILRSWSSMSYPRRSDTKLTFLNHTSKLASRTGMKGTGFGPGRCEIAKKDAVSSAAKNCSAARG